MFSFLTPLAAYLFYLSLFNETPYYLLEPTNYLPPLPPTLLVANALRACGMGLNPTVEGGVVLATIPKPSAETRENFVKVAAKAAEKVGVIYILTDAY